MLLQIRIQPQDIVRRLFGSCHQPRISREIRELERRQSMLPGAEEIARTALFEIRLRNREAVRRAAQSRKALFCILALVRTEEDTI